MNTYKFKYALLLTLIICVFFGIITRLVYLMVIQHDQYLERSEKQIQKLRDRREKYNNEILKIHKIHNDIYLTTAQTVLELAKNAKSLWLGQDMYQKIELMEKVLWNSTLGENEVDFKLKKAFGILAKMKNIEGLNEKSQSGLNSGLVICTSEEDQNVKWGGRRGSNPRQIESQSIALPTELRPPLILMIIYRSETEISQ